VSAALRTEVIGVRGMHCGGCERTVSLALTALPGVHGARADFVAEEVEVTFEPDRVGPAAMRAAVHDAGFTSP
jgi:copper chaperone CopZ